MHPRESSHGGAWYVNSVSQKMMRCTIRGGASVWSASASESESESAVYVVDRVFLLRVYSIDALCSVMDRCKAYCIQQWPHGPTHV
ncbi:hypothetical protein HETIRDRAFT_330567 [Heterobasidion irregulare TC 32-1]|uniref:Uncharacterized protein n=1 Tax=Heterobasidion irregulare (strain TC 32-1) TaxID=747525 RepID=W4JPB8_HETIT|nr:uncharacterized protein HETIRDRAFT_330567 [Heterobasidion irregulare TC 32-1]ETW75412.1 hypothetical protein HETIRDRAFT_330567 [Heterobasidion irregulare TC 32-1]